MAIPTVYRWDDKNAPVMTDMTDWTAIKAFYQTIFVDGYLEDDDITPKPGLGWTLTFDDINYEVHIHLGDVPVDLNNDVQPFIKHQYNRVITTTYQGIALSGYDNIIANGGQILVENEGLDTQGLIMGTNNRDPQFITPWIIIGTNKQFYSLGGSNYGTNYGVYEPTKPSMFSVDNKYATYSFFGEMINDGVDLGKYKVIQSGVENGIQLSIDSLFTYFHNSLKMSTADATGEFAFKYSRQLNKVINIHMNLIDKKTFFGGISRHLGKHYGHMKFPYSDDGLYIEAVDLWSAYEGVYFGKVPGLYEPMQNTPLTDTINPNALIEFEGTGEFTGWNFIGLGINTYYEMYIVTNQDWDLI